MTWTIQQLLTFAAGTTNTTTCAQDTETYLSNYLYVFILGQMLHGVGGTTVYTVGVALLDDSLPSQSTPLYLGKLIVTSHTCMHLLEGVKLSVISVLWKLFAVFIWWLCWYPCLASGDGVWRWSAALICVRRSSPALINRSFEYSLYGVSLWWMDA